MHTHFHVNTHFRALCTLPLSVDTAMTSRVASDNVETGTTDSRVLSGGATVDADGVDFWASSTHAALDRFSAAHPSDGRLYTTTATPRATVFRTSEFTHTYPPMRLGYVPARVLTGTHTHTHTRGRRATSIAYALPWADIVATENVHPREERML